MASEKYDRLRELKRFLLNIYWRNVFLCLIGHVCGLYGFYLSLTQAKWPTLIWSFLLLVFGGFGITGGAHRLWSHRSYKAKWPLRLLAAIGQTVTLQQSIYEWCWKHRMHHKYSETDADPFNIRRGFFFAHMGWMLCQEHSELKRLGQTIVMSDLLADPIVAHQRKFYYLWASLFGLAIPVLVPYTFWNESRLASFFVPLVFRCVMSFNITWMVNSVAHSTRWGKRPYDKSMQSTDNYFVAKMTIGEGWHNFHHVFPTDYKAAEFGQYSINWTTAIIDWFAYIGWAYDRKTVSGNLIRNRVKRTGDGSHRQDSLENKEKNLDDVRI